MKRIECVAVSLVAVMAVCAPARANGRFPSSVSVHFRGGVRDDVFLGTTFGLLISHDDGASFVWTCEQNIGYAGTFDPKYRVAVDGTIYATTFDGLRISRDGGCSFELATEGMSSSPGYIADTWIDALDVGSDGSVWVGSAEAGRPNEIYRSTDAGRTFTPLNLASSVIWWKSIAVPQSMPLRAFVTGYQVTQTDPDGGTISPRVHLLRTDDAGANWTALDVTMFTLGTSPLLLIEAVDPDDPDTVYVRSVRAAGVGDRLYRTADAGASWTEVLNTTDTIRSVVVRTDGNRDDGEVLVATQLGGVHRSTDKGATYQAIANAPQAACLGDRGDSLFACGANWEPDFFTLGRSPDGVSWTKVVRFVEIKGPLSCPKGTLQRDVCEAQLWPALREQFGIPGESGGVDATGPPSDRGGGCCDSGPRGNATSFGAAFAVLVLLVRRRRVEKPWSLLLVGAFVVSAPQIASANGRNPDSVKLVFRPGRPSDVLFGVTFGFMKSDDGGASWRWSCESAVGFSGTYDPDYELTPSGALFATTFDGLRLTRDGCHWSAFGPPVGVSFVSSIAVAPDGTIYVGVSDPGAGSAIYKSVDDGVTFAPTGSTGARLDWWSSLEVAPSDANRLYATAFRLDGMNPRQRLLFRSKDAGVTWEELPTSAFQGLEISDLYVVGIHPTNPDIVFIRMTLTAKPLQERFYRTTDAGSVASGGPQWQQVLEVNDYVQGFVVRSNGDVLAGATSLGLWRSTDGGQGFEQVATNVPLNPRCLEEHPDGTLYACGNNLPPDSAALARSIDGVNWAPVMSFQETAGPIRCDPGTVQKDDCQDIVWCGLREQLGIESVEVDCTDAGEGIDASVDGRPGASNGGGGCCRASPSGAAPIHMAVIALSLVRRRRRRSKGAFR